MSCIFLVLHLINFACLYSLPALFYRMALMLHLCNASIFKAVVKWCIIYHFLGVCFHQKILVSHSLQYIHFLWVSLSLLFVKFIYRNDGKVLYLVF